MICTKSIAHPHVHKHTRTHTQTHPHPFGRAASHENVNNYSDTSAPNTNLIAGKVTMHTCTSAACDLLCPLVYVCVCVCAWQNANANAACKSKVKDVGARRQTLRRGTMCCAHKLAWVAHVNGRVNGGGTRAQRRDPAEPAPKQTHTHKHTLKHTQTHRDTFRPRFTVGPVRPVCASNNVRLDESEICVQGALPPRGHRRLHLATTLHCCTRSRMPSGLLPSGRRGSAPLRIADVRHYEFRSTTGFVQSHSTHS